MTTSPAESSETILLDLQTNPTTGKDEHTATQWDPKRAEEEEKGHEEDVNRAAEGIDSSAAASRSRDDEEEEDDNAEDDSDEELWDSMPDQDDSEDEEDSDKGHRWSADHGADRKISTHVSLKDQVIGDLTVCYSTHSQLLSMHSLAARCSAQSSSCLKRGV